MGKTRNLFRIIRDNKGTFHAKMGTMNERNGRDLTEAEHIKKNIQKNYTKRSKWLRYQRWCDHTPRARHPGMWGQVCLQFSSVQSLSRVWLVATPWIAARQASLSITTSQSLLKLMSIKSVMPSSHLILCRHLLFLPPIPSSIRVFSNESTLHMRWPKYWSFSFSISPSNEHPGLISFKMDWLGLLAVQGTLKSLL